MTTVAMPPTTRMATRAGGSTVQDLIDKCEFAQYAPELANGDMNAVLDEAADIIDHLESVKRRV